MEVPFELLVLITEMLYKFFLFFAPFSHNFFKGSVFVFEFFDSGFIRNGKFVLIIFQLMDGAFELIILIAQCEVEIVLFKDGIFVDIVLLSEDLGSGVGFECLLFIIYHQLQNNILTLEFKS